MINIKNNIGKVLLDYCRIIYFNLTKYLTFLPTSPLSSSSLANKFMFKLMTLLICSNFEPIIKEELKWYARVHYDVQDLQRPLDIGHLCKFILKTEHLDQDIIEFGVASAGLTIILAHFLKKIGSKRKIIGCDTFEGFPYDDKYEFNRHRKCECCGIKFDQILEKIKKYDVNDKIVLVKGMFEETLYQKLSDKKYSLVFIDCDLYDSTKISLDYSLPRLVKGGIIAFDEYESEEKETPAYGETIAANEFCETNKLKIILDPIPHIIV